VAWVWKRDNRRPSSSRKLCEHEITPEEVKELLSEGRSPLIEDFVSKRGNKFGAHLILSQKKDKAEFEFPPR
jgi:DNA topoisomerase-3